MSTEDQLLTHPKPCSSLHWRSMRLSFSKFPILGLAIFVSALSFCQEKERRDCPSDHDQFMKIQQDAEQNKPDAQTILASSYELGRNVEPNGKEAIRLLTRAAVLGYAPAQYEVGRTYLYGRGIPADYQLALR